MTGANSAVGLRSTPVRYLFLDEVDGYPGDADGEGDPVDLAIQRTATFRGRRKIYMVSTPTLKGHSRIEAAFDDSDRRYLPCPLPALRRHGPDHLGAHPLARGAARRRRYLVCEACGGVHHEHDKPRLLDCGRMARDAPGDGRTAGFHLSALYSPWETWAEIAIEHGRVTQGPAAPAGLGQHQAGRVLGGPGGRHRAGRSADGAARGLGRGAARRRRRADRRRRRAGRPDRGAGRRLGPRRGGVGHRLPRALGRSRPGRASGPISTACCRQPSRIPRVLDLPIRATAIDTGGHHTKMAYEFCRTRLARRIWAIKGRGGPGIPVWPRRPTRTNKGKIPLFIVGVDAVKDAVYARLQA